MLRRRKGGGKIYILVLAAPSVAQKLCVLGHQDSAGIVNGHGTGVEGACKLGNGGGDTGHFG